MDRGSGYNRLARKLVHIAGGLPAFALPFIPYWLAVAGSALGVVLAFSLRPDHAWWLRSITKPSDRSIGIITGLRGYFTAVLILILAWPLLERLVGDSAVHYVMFGWLALAWGDGLAGIIGPGPRVAPTTPWNRQKTWWGVLGCAIGSALAWLCCFWLLAGRGGVPLSAMLMPAALSGLLVALLETLELPVDDNYTVGLGAPLIALLVAQLFAWA